MMQAGFLVLEAQFIRRRLEAVLDRPAMALDRDEGLNVRSGRAPGRNERQIVVADGAGPPVQRCEYR